MAEHTLAVLLTAWSAILSVASFATMARDKRAARTSGRRVPESRLLTLAMLGGAWGAWAGMSLARHKTRHWRFRLVVPLSTALWTALVIGAWLGRGPAP